MPAHRLSTVDSMIHSRSDSKLVARSLMPQPDAIDDDVQSRLCDARQIRTCAGFVIAASLRKSTIVGDGRLVPIDSYLRWR
jgi:hypothetical protein